MLYIYLFINDLYIYACLKVFQTFGSKMIILP